MQIIRDIIKRVNQELYSLQKQKGQDTPDMRKVSVIARYARKYPDCKIFIETGTYFGATPYALKDTFRWLYTIELDEWLYKRAIRKFKDIHNVFCFNGDSVAILKRLLPTIKEPVIYWLDAHYSRGLTAKGNSCTPILKELREICSHESVASSVILIDDADCFGTVDDYPEVNTIIWNLKLYLKGNYERMEVVTTDNMIIIKPK